ncbi:hypothetical protein CBS101457_001277 [Exobasidium rhododendri]|nr:hypothetical protein CBS101457_001277 [Exobasidium rhododendri]
MPSSARGQRHAPTTRDPLTTLLILFAYPIFLFLFILLHASYYLFLKLIANIQWQRYVYSQARQRPKDLLNSWKDGLRLSKVGSYTAQRASEERLLKRGNIVRSVGRVVAVEGRQGAGSKAKNQKMLVPRHLALVLASRPKRLRSLFFRACHSVLRSRGKYQGKEFTRHWREGREEEEQVKYAMESVKTALRCCALAGIEEVSIYDEAGRMKQEVMRKGQPDWVLEWPLDQDWEDPREEEVPSDEFQTPRSESFSSVSPSFSSALDSPPTLSSQPSSVSLSNLREVQPLLAFIQPMLSVSASLHVPFRNLEEVASAKVGEARKNVNGLSSFDAHRHHAKIKVNLLGPEDGKGALARAASIMAARKDKPKVIDVKTIDDVLHCE